MKLEERALTNAVGTLLMHNIADARGSRVLKKGIVLTEEHVAQLRAMGHTTVAVAVLGTDDIHEDEAALVLAAALQTSELVPSAASGGRVNLRAAVDGLLQVDAGRLVELNTLPGIALATRRQHLVVGPRQETDNVATLKIIPYAVRRRDLDRAVALASPRPGILEIRPFQRGRQVALLLVGEPAVHDRLRDDFAPATRTRVERLGAELTIVEAVPQEEEAIAAAAARLAGRSDLLIVVGQTSIMDEDDTTLRALRRAGAGTTLSGAPVEPGNLLALAYFPDTPVLCAPGSARGLRRNAVDMVLPRLLLGERLGRREIAALGLGGFLTAAERAGDLT